MNTITMEKYFICNWITYFDKKELNIIKHYYIEYNLTNYLVYPYSIILINIKQLIL